MANYDNVSPINFKHERFFVSFLHLVVTNDFSLSVLLGIFCLRWQRGCSRENRAFSCRVLLTDIRGLHGPAPIGRPIAKHLFTMLFHWASLPLAPATFGASGTPVTNL